MSKPTILLLLGFTFFHNLNKHDLFSSFSAIKGSDSSSYFQYKTLSLIETVALMATCSCFCSCTMHFTLIKTFNMLETSVFHHQNEHALLEMKRQCATIIRTKFKSFTYIMALTCTLFCILTCDVGSYDWTLFSYFGKGKISVKFLSQDTTKTLLFIVAHL